MRHLFVLFVACVSFVSMAADFRDIDPDVFPKDDPRAKELPNMMRADATKRMKEANMRESKAFAEVTTKEQWEKYRDVRIQKLKESLGIFPETPKDLRIEVTRKLEGDGYVIHNLLYATRSNFWVSANLYLPARIPDRMPGIIISHSHHTPKTQGELQDMGMTWARSGVAVLIPDHLGQGERRQHDFVTDDYEKMFGASRQDYYFRYNSNMQLSAVGESLMGWMVWDLMRGVDVLLKQNNIDKDRIIMLGAVAGGGDPAGVTAALDSRISCVVPYNFGGLQQAGSQNVHENPDRDAAWFSSGSWESTRGLKYGARDGFAHYIIVGAVAPRPVIFAHEFSWDGEKDPAWPRLQKIFGFYGATDKLISIQGKGAVTGPGGPDNTHCWHIGAVHRKDIYPALKEWFDMSIPEEYSKRLPISELLCWTADARAELQSLKLQDVLPKYASDLETARNKPLLKMNDAERFDWQRREWAKILGNIDPFGKPKVIEGKTDEVPGGRLGRFVLEMEPGIVVPLLLIMPEDTKIKVPVAVMIAQDGKAGFIRERDEAIGTFLKAGVAVCLVDVRGTGETQSGASAGRSSSRTSVSETNLILGQTVIGSQLRDLRTVIRWLSSREGIDGKRVGVWGDSFAKVNLSNANVVMPLDADNLPAISEPGAAELVSLAGMYEEVPVYFRGAIDHSFLSSPYIYCPHDAIVPGAAVTGGRFDFPKPRRGDLWVNGHNQISDNKSLSPQEAANWLIRCMKN